MSKTHLMDGICLNSEQCGLLSVEEERLSKMIKKEPITNVYDVEQTPFARGKFAAVRRCTHRETGVPYAAKFIRKRRRAMDQRQDIVHEVAVLQLAANSARIVRLHEVYETANEMALVLELAEGGELQHVLDTVEGMDEQHIITVMRQILDGLCFLHQRNIAHLDLKPQNLLLTGVYPDCDIKLCDFGISRVIQPGVEVREILGTPDYVAPEILNYEPISLATDIWSVGVLAYVLVSGGYSPFAGDSKQETFCNISQCNLNFPAELFSDASSLAKDFISATLKTNPNTRLTSEQCLSHPWLSCVVPDINTSLTLTLTTTPNRLTQSNGVEPHVLGTEDEIKESADPTCCTNGHCSPTNDVDLGSVEKDDALCDHEVGEINLSQRHNSLDSKSCSCSSEEERDDLPVHKRPKNSPEGRRSSFPISSCLCCRRSESPLSSEFLKNIGCQHRHYSSPSVGILLDRSVIY